MAENGKGRHTRQRLPASGWTSRLASRQGRNQGLHYPPWQAAFSEEALQRAWLPVRANRGRAAGNESVAEFEQALAANLDQLRRALLMESYRPHPVKEILVPKGGDGWRPITLWTVADRVVQRAVYDYLAPIWDAQFHGCSYGFRQNRGVQDVALAIEDARRGGASWVVDADIEDCFD